MKNIYVYTREHKYLLIFPLIFIIVLLTYSLSYASFDDGNESSGNYQISDDDIFQWSVTANPWVSGLRYRTDAIVLHTHEMSGRNPISNTGGNRYVVIPVYAPGQHPSQKGQDLDVILHNDFGNYYYKSGAICFDSPDGNKIKTSCRIDAPTIKQIMLQLFGEELNTTKRVYASHVFQVKNGTFESLDITKQADRNKLVWNYNDMRAYPWSSTTQGLLLDYYNKTTTFTPKSYVFKVYYDVDKPVDPNSFGFYTMRGGNANEILNELYGNPSILYAEVVKPTNNEKAFATKPDKDQLLWKLPSSPNISLDSEYYVGGSLYKLDSSYIWSTSNINKKFEVKPSPLVRNTTLAHGNMIIYAGYKTNAPPPPSYSVPDFACTFNLGESRTNPASTMNHNATGMIKADDMGANKFDVSRGVPTGESLYTKGDAKPYLVNYKFQKITGECTWEIPVSKNFSLSWTDMNAGGCIAWNVNNICIDWEDIPRSGSENVSTTVTVKRQFSFWEIDSFGLYKIMSMTYNNLALPSGRSITNATGINVTADMKAEADRFGKIKGTSVVALDLPAGSKSGGYSRPTVTSSEIVSAAKTLAESKVAQLQVRNDKLIVNGGTIMSDSWTTKDAPAPVNIPTPTVNTDFFKSNLVIPLSVQDSTYSSSGLTTYQRVLAKDNTVNPLNRTYSLNINDVTVRTPVVNYSKVNRSAQSFDQYWGSNNSANVGVVGSELTIDFDNGGQHLNILGFGNRDYGKYVGVKRAQFSFPVYIGSTYYQEGTWVPVGPTGVTVKIAEWAKEGANTIRTESWAHNNQSYNACNTSFNGTLGVECAVNIMDIQLVGRMYGFTVYDIGDFRYETVFRTAKGSTTYSGFKYGSGLADKDGIANDISTKPQLALPVRPGSHPKEIATTPHNGYAFSFYFTSVGEYWGNSGYMKIVPKFYFVPKSGGTPVAVDLYYNTTTEKLVKVGSANDNKFSRVINMADPLRAIDQNLWKDTLGFEYDNLVGTQPRTKSDYTTRNLERKVTIAKGYKDMTLDYRTRLLIGPVDASNGVDSNLQKASRQRWFGEFSLPIDPYVLAEGTDIEKLAREKYKGTLSGKEAEFKTDGYIIVNFQIYGYKNGNTGTPYMAYDASAAGNANMWDIEKQVRSSTGYLGGKFNYHFGDIMMFESDFSVKDDYK